MAWVAAIPAAIGAASSLFGGRQARKTEIELANTAHQREVRDLREAGLNPILSGTGGAGAAVPAQEDIVGPAVNSALAQRMVSEELRSIRSARRLTEAQARKEDYLGDQAQTAANLGQRLSDTNFSLGVASAHAIEQENEIRRQELSRREASQEVFRMKPGELMRNWKELDIGQLGEMLNSILGTGNSARSLIR